MKHFSIFIRCSLTQWWQGLRFTIAGFSWEFVWWSTDVSVNTQFIVETICPLYQFCCMHMCLCCDCTFGIENTKLIVVAVTMRRRNYLETSIAIIKMPSYCSESHSQLYQSSTNVRLHSCSFIMIQFLSLQAVRLIIMITLCIAPQRDFLWPRISPMCCPYFSYRYVCIWTFVYIICIPIIFVLNDYIHTFSIHCTWSFSIIKLFIIGQVLSYTNNCKKMEQSN